ncbi:hypothetical protein COX05_00665 [candidate division WWE3 bacterium CG22_combo_CG10-13_8_21_14_all_39_12]|uniref:ATP synthase F1 complex delta/epsilon subunit N-terminal domain-containing protein n=2 Tax=Katanobacteria TaxID=422282 RepID=A0A2M7X4Z1_UNCKA|nr:MAG: hypothetical protein COX05_00665 [candidate division WWE3 bacterium CG22_combo_CG10-13_8_21_14_all_39_12]PJA41235.1 MAG: hypothetical protein CO179_00325 [candidate division WWE3 bacterium CG_4_9_14_3_um_filter_39_7]
MSTQKITEESNQKIHIYVGSPEKILFEGEAIGLTTFNSKGEFSIIPQHINFRTLIQDKIAVHVSNDDIKEFTISKGVLSFSNNKLEAYII